MLFQNRIEAGRLLSEKLGHLSGEDVVVLGLPRGGVPVAAEVAEAIDAPLDVIVVRKLGVPYHPELAMGAVGEGGVRVVNEDVVRATGVTAEEFEAVEERERVEVAKRATRFRGGRPPVDLTGRTALVIDDGVATGSTARAACQVARAMGAARVVLAVPVAPEETIEAFDDDVDEVMCLQTPYPFLAVGQFYRDFSQTEDNEVTEILQAAAMRDPAGQESGAGHPSIRDEEVDIPVGAVVLTGDLRVPEGASGVVVFAHGSGSSRHSPRNRFVARVLNDAGLATLLFDLLTPTEEYDRRNVFDIDLLADRLAAVRSWLGDLPEIAGLRIGYFGASTGAAAALVAAAQPEANIGAVVSRGGRPDLAADHLAAVGAPTLLIVGSHDPQVLELNRSAQAAMDAECRLAVVTGASHLFEEPGTLQEAAELARDWFMEHLVSDVRRILARRC